MKKWITIPVILILMMSSEAFSQIYASIANKAEFQKIAYPHKIPRKQKLKSYLVRSIPEGATVFLNEKLMGKTPLYVEVYPGYHRIKLIKSGYMILSDTVFLSKKDKVINCTLQRIDDPTSHTPENDSNKPNYWRPNEIQYDTIFYSTSGIDYSFKAKDYQANYIKVTDPTSKSRYRKRTKEEKASYQVGILYKHGFFSGEVGDTYSTYRFFKPVFLSSRYKKFYFDLGISLIGVVDEFNRGKVQNIYVEEKFYSRAWDIFFSVGSEILVKNDFSLTTTLSYCSLHHSYYTRKIGLFNKVGKINRETSYENDGIDIIAFGPGVFIDYNLWNLKNYMEDDLIVRIRYNALFLSRNIDFNIGGIMHEIQVGLLINLHK